MVFSLKRRMGKDKLWVKYNIRAAPLVSSDNNLVKDMMKQIQIFPTCS